MTANPEQFPKSSESNIPHGHEPVSPDALPIQPGISAPDSVYEGFEVRPPSIPERQDWEQKRTDVQKSYTQNPETKNNKRRNFIIAGGAAAVSGVLLAIGGVFGASGGGTVNLQPTKPTAEAPANPGTVTPIETTPTRVETNPAVIQPEIVSKDQQIFHDANGNEQTYEERVEANELSTKEFPTGEDGFVGFFKRAEQMAEYYPTEKEVRKNLSLPANQPLTRENYILAAELHNKTFDPIFDQPGSLTGNSLYSVVNQVARTNVGLRYDRLNDSDTTNDNIPFDVTYSIDKDKLLYFSYSDNTFDTEPTKYEMASTRDVSRTNSTTPAWKIPSNIKISQAATK